MAEQKERLTPAEKKALDQAAGYKDVPGNQTPDTPGVRESDQRYPRGEERHKQEYGRLPGNQTADTPDVNESERGRKKR